MDTEIKMADGEAACFLIDYSIICLILGYVFCSVQPFLFLLFTGLLLCLSLKLLCKRSKSDFFKACNLLSCLTCLIVCKERISAPSLEKCCTDKSRNSFAFIDGNSCSSKYLFKIVCYCPIVLVLPLLFIQKLS